MFRGAVPALDITNLDTGLELTQADDTLIDEETPSDHNKLYTDGSFWANTDALNVDHIGLQQVVFDSADVATTGASYKSFDVNVPSQVLIGHDENITTPAWLTSWEDTGKEHVVNNKNLRIFASFFDAGTVTVGGNSGSVSDEMMVCTVSPGYARVENEAGAGSIEFAASSYQGDDDAGNITFTVNRVGGTEGAASATVSITAGGAHGTLNTTSVSWSASDATPQNGTVTPNDVTGNQTMTLGLSAFMGAAEGGRSSTNIQITDAGGTPTATEYFVNGSTGDDTNDGESAGNAWETIGKANASASAVAGGHVDVFIEGPQTYTDDPIDPINSGTDDTHRIRFKPRNGDVTLKGPGSNMDYAIDIDQDFISVLDDSTYEFIIDGEAVFVVDSKPTSYNIKYGIRVTGDNNRVECQHNNTYGYIGCSQQGDMNEYKINGNGHGSPNDGSIAWADHFVQQLATGNHCLVEDSEWTRGGHAPVGIRSGSALFRHTRLDNDWTGTSGFATNDGHRGGAFWGVNTNSGEDGTGSIDSTIDDCIFRFGGTSLGSPGATSIRSNGTNRRIIRSFFINGRGDAVQQEDLIGHRIVHCTFNNVAGKNGAILINNRTNTFGVYQPVNNWRCFNSIFHDIGNNKALRIRNWRQSISGNWWDHIFFHDNMLDASTVNIEIHGNSGDPGYDASDYPGTITIANAISSYPSNFYNISYGDPLFADETNLGPVFADVYTDYTCSSSSVLNQGVALTTAVNTEVSSTALDVVDAMSIPKPFGFPGPSSGPEAGQGFRIHIEGVGNVTYSDVNYSTNVITLDSPQSWNAGDEINFPFNGSAPNIGAVQ